MGFFTDTSVCIDCKACEVACKEWNLVPDDGFNLLGMSFDNTGMLGANSWRHVIFIEQERPLGRQDLGIPSFELPGGGTGAEGRTDFRWLMMSDVCKHCTHAGCLDVCPTGALFRTEFGTVVVQQDICNGCGYCVSGCPYGVIDRRPGDGRAQKCTLCYDRLRGGLEPACAKACPTDSIQFGPLDELRERATQRLEQLHQSDVTEARLYGDHGGVRLPRRRHRDLPGRRPAMSDRGSLMFDRGRRGGRAADGSREQSMVPRAEFRSYYGRPVLKPPVWEWKVPAYLFTGGLSAGSAVLAAGADLTGRPALRRAGRIGALVTLAASTYFLIADLGRPERFHHMLRVAKPTSPMSVGTWILAAYGPGVGVAAASELLPGPLRRTVLGRLLQVMARPAGLSSAIIAPAVAAYTAVLLSQTAVPAWRETHPHLPFVFTGSAAASAGGLAMVLTPVREAGPARRFAAVGAASELAASRLMESRLGLIREAYTTGKAHRLRKWAEYLTAAGLIGTVVAARRSQALSVTSGLALLAGSLLQRLAIFEAGVASTKDPRYVVLPQRQRINEAKLV